MFGSKRGSAPLQRARVTGGYDVLRNTESTPRRHRTLSSERNEAERCATARRGRKRSRTGHAIAGLGFTDCNSSTTAVETRSGKHNTDQTTGSANTVALGTTHPGAGAAPNVRVPYDSGRNAPRGVIDLAEVSLRAKTLCPSVRPTVDGPCGPENGQHRGSDPRKRLVLSRA